MLNFLSYSGFAWAGSHFPKAAVCNSQNTTIGHQTVLALLIISPQFSRPALTSPTASLHTFPHAKGADFVEFL